MRPIYRPTDISVGPYTMTANMLSTMLLCLILAAYASSTVISEKAEKYGPIKDRECCKENYFQKSSYDKGTFCYPCSDGWVNPEPCTLTIRCKRAKPDSQPDQRSKKDDSVKPTAPSTTHKPIAIPLTKPNTLSNNPLSDKPSNLTTTTSEAIGNSSIRPTAAPIQDDKKQEKDNKNDTSTNNKEQAENDQAKEPQPENEIEAKPESEGLPQWAYVLIGLGILICVLLVIALYCFMKKRNATINKNTPNAGDSNEPMINNPGFNTST